MHHRHETGGVQTPPPFRHQLLRKLTWIRQVGRWRKRTSEQVCCQTPKTDDEGPGLVRCSFLARAGCVIKGRGFTLTFPFLHVRLFFLLHVLNWGCWSLCGTRQMHTPDGQQRTDPGKQPLPVEGGATATDRPPLTSSIHCLQLKTELDL